VASLFITRGRTERVIAAGRVLLAALALLAVWLDPAERMHDSAPAYVLMAAYLGYAIGLVPILRPAFAPAAWWPILTHAVDLGAFVLLMQFTEGAFSPFFVYFLFSLTAATLRWQWRGAVLTGTAALALFAAMAIYAAAVAPEQFDLRAVISRSVTLLLATGMLAYLGAAHARGLSRLETLAAWRHSAVPDRAALVREIVESAAAILGAPRLLIVWETEEPWVDVALWDRGRFASAQEPPGTFGTVTAEGLRGRSFICLDAARSNARGRFVKRGSKDGCSAWTRRTSPSRISSTAGSWPGWSARASRRRTSSTSCGAGHSPKTG
jgi:hypothetical protein